MKKVLCIVLALVLGLSLVPSMQAEDQFAAVVDAKGITDGTQLFTVAQITNTSSVDGVVTAYKAVFNKNGEEIRAQKEKIDVSFDEPSVNKSIYVDYSAADGEVAKVFFWRGDSMEPLCKPVVSTDVPEGPIEESKIEITSSMMFASSEIEADCRATKAADGDLDSYWSAKGVMRNNQQSVTAYLEHDYSITKIGIAFGLGSERQYVFTVLTSTDGKNYTQILGETVSELTDEVQYFDLPMAVGNFLRVNIIERVVPDDENWVRICEVEAYGMLIPYDAGEEVEFFGFDYDEGTKIDEQGEAVDGFIALPMDERSMKYTSSLGENLYADVSYLPDTAGMGVKESALHLVDYVGRTTDEKNGAGGILVGKRYETNADREKYNLSFNMVVPSGDSLDSYWSGFSITDEMVSGGNDLEHYAAIQIRLEDSGDGFVLRQLPSNYFNEGSLVNFMGTTFKKDALVNISMNVYPKARRVDMTVTDGENSETRTIYFSYNDGEQARISTWSDLEAKYLVFNTGAGKKNEIYVDDIKVTHFETEIEAETPSKKLGHIDMSEDNNGEFSFKNIADDKGEEAYTGSLGEKLYAEICEAPIESGIEGNVLHLFDEVGRVTDETNGAGGVMAYVKLPVPENKQSKYRIDFTLYSPVADEYGGFSLSSGIDGSYGMQLRYAPSKVDKNNLQLNKYSGNTFNGGEYDALVGSKTAITKANPWQISIVVDMLRYQSEITIDDGINSQTRTVKMATTYEDWTDKNLDTLAFNTGIGGIADIYAGDITVTDLGYNPATKSAINGLLRLVAVKGTGKMLHHQGNEVSDFVEKHDPAYTRFVERPGLMDSDGVSFEVANRPGYFLTIVPGTDNTVQVQPFANTARYKANATFFKQDGGVDPKNYGKSTVSYASYRDPSRYFYDDSGSTVVWKRHEKERSVFYLRNEASNSRISDNFNGTSIDTSKWLTEYPWGDSHNHMGLARKSSVWLKDGVCTLAAVKIGDNDWPKSHGKYSDTGIKLSQHYPNITFPSGWTKWNAYVGVLSPHKYNNGYHGDVIYWRQSYIEGSFKQPNCGQGYWTAFWLSGAASWPPETDIFEYLSSCGDKGPHGWYTNMHMSSSSSQGAWLQGSNLRTQFHRYALDWGYDYMDMYYDGKIFARYTGDIVNKQNSGGCVLIMNTGIAGWERAWPSEYNIGLSIEWLRSFQY